MFTTLGDDTFYFMPICFHPTTTLLVDDDANFLKNLSLQLKKKLPIKTFTDPDEAIYQFENMYQYFTFRLRLTNFDLDKVNKSNIILTIRNEIYNPNRFKEVITTVVDYNMPNKNGLDLMKSMGTEGGSKEIRFHSYILLSGTSDKELDTAFSESSVAEQRIHKSDAHYVTKLLERIQRQSALNTQWFSYPIARNFADSPTEQARVLLDGNFLPILNDYLHAHQICELFLFDRQGSLLFLDKDANFSWMIIRNEEGMKNSIQMAKHHNAPNSVIQRLMERKAILSLYEPIDFQNKKNIRWDDYLLEPHVFEGDNKYFKAWPIHHDNALYYYSFTDELKHHGIFQDQVLSYSDFMKIR